MIYLLSPAFAISLFGIAHYVDVKLDKHIDELTECGYAAVRGE